MSATTPPMKLKREDYKAVKHMDRTALTAYLTRVYIRGYEAGQKAAQAASASSARDAN